MHPKIKRILSIVVGVLVLAILALFIYAYFDSRSTGGTVTDSIRNIFPTTTDTVVTPPDNTNTTPDNTTIGTSTPPTVDLYTSRLIPISMERTSGSFMYSTSTVRYIDTAAGHIYDFDLNTRTAKQVTYTSIPAIYDSYWINKKQFIARYLDTDNNTTIRSILATIDEEKASVSTATLPDDITNVVIGDKGQIYYTYITITGRTMGVRYDMEKDTSTTLFELPVSEITLFWHNNDLYGYENPSAYSTGNVFNIQNGIFTYVYGPLQGLSAHSISDTEIVITGEGRSIVLNTEDNTTTNLSLPVLAEKCLSIVSTTYCGYQKNNYTPMPDLWYQGVVSFNDGLYGFQGSQNYLEYDFSFAEAVIDMVGPYNSPDSNYVILQNKKDNSLWALSMETSIQR